MVIVTVAMRRDAHVLLRDDETDAPAKASFPLTQGSAYCLSGPARNTCAHGVLCDEGVEDRESLNLRWGLHTQRRADEEIYQHWAGAFSVELNGAIPD